VSVVVDASMTMAWHFEDERTKTVNDILSWVAESGAVVPFHWRAEVANSFLVAERRSRTTADFTEKSLNDLEELPIAVDPHGPEKAWRETRRLAAEHRLTIYDAIYLELAIRAELPLATLDLQLARAARAAGVMVMGAAV
jgi:predicted nucleic acid-binding protein